MEDVRCAKSSCLQWKPRSEFKPDVRKRNGLRSWCSACYREYQRGRSYPRSAAASAKDNAKKRERWACDSEYRDWKSKSNQAYYEAHKDQFRDWNRESYLRRRDTPEFKAWHATWRAKNADRRIGQAKARKARAVRHAGGFEKIYAITDGEAIKIGWTRVTAEYRRSELQIGTHRQLHVMAWWDGNKDDEAGIHQRFAHLAIRGEWFRADPSLVEFIEAHGNQDRAELQATREAGQVSSE